MSREFSNKEEIQRWMNQVFVETNTKPVEYEIGMRGQEWIVSFAAGVVNSRIRSEIAGQGVIFITNLSQASEAWLHMSGATQSHRRS